MRLRFSLPALLLTLTAVTASAQPKRAGDCDRHCLLAFLTEYTEAITDNNLARLAVAPTVRVTSNGQVAELGKGQVWGAGRRLPYRQTFVDPLSGAAVFYGVVTTASRPARGGAKPAGDAAQEHSWFYVVRLRVELQRITEVEEVSYEPPQGRLRREPVIAQPSRPDLRRVAAAVRARLAPAALRHREQVFRRRVAQDRLPRRAVASGVPTDRARRVHREHGALARKLRRRVPDAVREVERHRTAASTSPTSSAAWCSRSATS